MSASIVPPVSTKDNFGIEKGERKFAPKDTPFRRRQWDVRVKATIPRGTLRVREVLNMLQHLDNPRRHIKGV